MGPEKEHLSNLSCASQRGRHESNKESDSGRKAPVARTGTLGQDREDQGIIQVCGITMSRYVNQCELELTVNEGRGGKQELPHTRTLFRVL